MDQKTYFEMREKVNKHLITEEDWIKFCEGVLAELMEENKDVLIRLKNR